MEINGCGLCGKRPGKDRDMREILFRAKRKNNRGWICGSFVKKVSGVYIISESITGCIADYTEHEVDPETVCQYTGLTDKNGRKIFEGDIVKSDLDKIGKIVYNESHLAYLILENSEMKYYYIQECDSGHIEVVGNIFDNPELVEDNA